MPDPRPTDDAPPLAGLRVLDLSRVLAGPLCTMVLGDLGADVIKVERPGQGDDTRQWGPPWAGDESAYFLCVNRNKRSVAADLKSDAGQALVRRLARGAGTRPAASSPARPSTRSDRRLPHGLALARPT